MSKASVWVKFEVEVESDRATDAHDEAVAAVKQMQVSDGQPVKVELSG